MAAADFDLHTLAGAYAMDAVSDDERGSFAAHLTDCEQCRIDVRELREATARLGMAAAVRPRPELRERAIRAASHTSQLGPVIKENPATAGQAGKAGGAAALRQAVRRLRSARISVRAGLVAATVLAAAAAVLGGVTNSAMQQLHHSEHQDHLIDAVFNAPDHIMLSGQVVTGGTATVVMSHREHAAVVMAHDLRALPGNLAYEIWLMGPGGTRPAGMLTSQPGGMAGPAIVSGLGRDDMIALTVEPMTGAKKPTSVLLVLIKPRPHAR
jgi:Anti-sigma-K factor rskA